MKRLLTIILALSMLALASCAHMKKVDWIKVGKDTICAAGPAMCKNNATCLAAFKAACSLLDKAALDRLAAGDQPPTRAAIEAEVRAAQSRSGAVR